MSNDPLGVFPDVFVALATCAESDEVFDLGHEGRQKADSMELL